MTKDMITKFDILDINNKRNIISDELILINELIRNFETKYNIQNNTIIKNYNQIEDKELTEAEMLTFFYEDIYNLEQELITALTIFNATNN